MIAMIARRIATTIRRLLEPLDMDTISVPVELADPLRNAIDAIERNEPLDLADEMAFDALDDVIVQWMIRY